MTHQFFYHKRQLRKKKIKHLKPIHLSCGILNYHFISFFLSFFLWKNCKNVNSLQEKLSSKSFSFRPFLWCCEVWRFLFLFQKILFILFLLGSCVYLRRYFISPGNERKFNFFFTTYISPFIFQRVYYYMFTAPP